MNDGMIPPQDLVLEKQILNSMLESDVACGEGLSSLKKEHFYSTMSGNLFNVILMADDKGDVNSVTVGSLIDKRDVEQYLHEVLEAATVNSIKPQMAILQNLYQKRQLILNLHEAAKKCYEKNMIATNIVSDLDKKNSTVTETSPEVRVYNNKECISKTMDDLEERRGKLNGVLTGFKIFDEMYGGLGNGEIITIAGCPGTGKSAMVSSMFCNISAQGGIPLLFTLEMPLTTMMHRMMSNHSGIDKGKFRMSSFSKEDCFRLAEVCDSMSNNTFFINESGSLTVHQIRQIARRMKKTEDIGVIFVDYLQIIARCGLRSTKDEIDESMRVLRMLAKELNIPIVILSQLNRSYANAKRPSMAMLKESGKIEEDSHLVMLLYNLLKSGGDEPAPRVNGIVDKCREGVTGELKFWFEGALSRFTEWENSINDPAEEVDPFVQGVDLGKTEIF